MRGRDRFAIGVRRIWPLLILLVLVVTVTKLGALGSEALDRTVITMLVNMLLVVSLYTFVGNSGVFSFGQLSYMAVGAYVAGVLTIPVDRKEILLTELPGFLAEAHLGSIEAVLLAGLVAGAVGAILAFPLARLSGLVAALATFAILLVTNVVARSWTDITNGTRGMSAIPVTTTVDRALIFVLAAIAAAFLFQESRLGRRLRASREDEAAARSIGIRVGWERGSAYVLSAFLGGIAGGLYAQFVGSISPDALFLGLTFLTVAMLVVGGITSLAGGVIGTIAISAVSEFLRRIEGGIDIGALHVEARSGLQELGLGLIMLLILLVRPRGLTRGREIRWPLGNWEAEWRDRRSRAARDRDQEADGASA